MTERVRRPEPRLSTKSRFWMQPLAFTGLHRMFRVLADHPEGLRPLELNRHAVDAGLAPPDGSAPYSATTLFHYRNTLREFGLVRKDGKVLLVDEGSPEVPFLLSAAAAAVGAGRLSGPVKDSYARLVLGNRDCADLFFGLFAPHEMDPVFLWHSWETGVPVRWYRDDTSDGKPEVVLRNTRSGRTLRYDSYRSISAVLYGLRYWARNELGLLDEYGECGGYGTVLFPVAPALSASQSDNFVFRELLDHCSPTTGDWALLSVSDLITQLCQDRRRPIQALDHAIERLAQQWPRHIYLVPTSPALATLTSPNRASDELKLRSYYKTPDGPYVSHIRVHRAVTENRAT